MIKKSLQELSWKVEESEYRDSSYISYSKLAQFARNGPQSILHTESTDTPATRFGSIVDYLLTKNSNKKEYLILNGEVPTGKAKSVLEHFFQCDSNLEDLSDDILLSILNKEGYRSDLKLDKSRLKKFREEVNPCYDILREAYIGNLKVISNQEYEKAFFVAHSLKNSNYTKDFFISEHEDVELLYQAKFKLDDMQVRCMFDMIKVDHKKKTILPMDIKTTSIREEDFCSSILKWRYDIQAELYSHILQSICRQDEYFSSFQILPFTFIVANKDYPLPMAWVYYKDAALLIVKKNWEKLLDEYKFHLKNQMFDYSFDTIMSGGKRYVQFNLFTI